MGSSEWTKMLKEYWEIRVGRLKCLNVRLTFDTEVSKARQNMMKWHFEIRKRQKRDMTFPPQPSWIMNCSTRSQYHHPPHSKALRAKITQDLSLLKCRITLNGHHSLKTSCVLEYHRLWLGGPHSLAAEQTRQCALSAK